VQAAAAPPLGSVIEFDLDDLSLDLDAPADHHGVDLSLDIGMESPLQSVSATPPVNVDPVGDADANGWSTKLELAEEFHAIGDDEGARGLAEEVFEVASGDLKRKAERLLSQLS
jgi:pilus assembly protein FimV